MPDLSDPPDAPEGSASGIKPRELVNHAIILQPTGVRIAHDSKKQEDFEIVDCRFWRLESTGVAEEGTTGISWWKAREQLRSMIGEYVACRPKQGDDNAIALERLTGAPREIAAKVVASFAAAPLAESPPPDDEWDDDSEPF